MRTLPVDLGGVTTAQRIRDIAAGNPEFGHAKIARMVDCDKSYVYNVRRRAGLLPSSSRKPIIANLDRDNNIWLLAQARRSNVSLEEMLNSIITDARIEDDE